jgi:exosortase/archaeosortase family protein
MLEPDINTAAPPLTIAKPTPTGVWLALALVLVAHWYCVTLYVQRVIGWTELLPEYLAFVTAVVLLGTGDRPKRRESVEPGWLAVPVLLSAVSFGRVPELCSLMLAVASLAVFLWVFGITRHVAVWGLLLLSLPILSRLPLFLGYPLRIATGILAAPLLKLQGLNAVREGTVFRIGEQLVVIDAPCSGTNMLWAVSWVAFTLSAFCRLSNGRTVVACGCALVVVVIANAVRSTSLVLAEVRGLELSNSEHAAVGVVCYVGLLAAITLIIRRLAPRSTGSVTDTGLTSTRLLPRLPLNVQWAAVAVACVCSAGAPLFALPVAHMRSTDFPGWPTHFDGHALVRIELQDYERRYAAEFPGRLARFTDDNRQIMFQWLPTHSRSVHSAADCLRNVGYRVRHGPVLIDRQSTRWSSATATRDGVTVRVRERIESAAGQHWQDVSAWYWDAILDRTTGPYWVVIVTEPQ